MCRGAKSAYEQVYILLYTAIDQNDVRNPEHGIRYVSSSLEVGVSVQKCLNPKLCGSKFP